MATPPLPPLTKGPPPTPEEVIKTELPKIKDNSTDTITELEGIAKILSKSSTPIAGRSSKSPIAKSRVSESRSFSSSSSSDDTGGANFAKDFVRHFSKKIGDELEDMTTFFGFNFGKHFKDGLVQTIKGKGAFGTAIKFMFKPFEGMMKASSKLFRSTDDSRLADFSEKRFKDKSLKEDELLDIQSKLETAKGEERVNLKIRENELHKEILNIKEELKKAKLAELKLENDRLQKLEDDAKKIGDSRKEKIAQIEKHKVSDKYVDLTLQDVKNLEDSDLEILKFESGTKGVLGNIFADFGDGTPVVLHGKEAVIPENSEEGKLLKQYESSGLKQISPDSPDFELIKPEKDSKFDISPISSMLESINFNIIQGFSSILTFFKEDSDRNEQLKDAELSRQRLLSEAKKETSDKGEIEIIIDRPEEKKSPFSFLKSIFSGIFGDFKKFIPLFTSGLALLAVAAAAFTDLPKFISETFEKLSNNILESITSTFTKIGKSLDKILGRVIDRLSKKTGQELLEKGVNEGVERSAQTATDKLTKNLAQRNAEKFMTSVAQDAPSELIEAQSTNLAKKLAEKGLFANIFPKLTELTDKIPNIPGASVGSKFVKGVGGVSFAASLQEIYNRMDAGQSGFQAVAGELGDMIGSLPGQIIQAGSVAATFGSAGVATPVTLGTAAKGIGVSAAGSVLVEEFVDWLTGASNVKDGKYEAGLVTWGKKIGIIGEDGMDVEKGKLSFMKKLSEGNLQKASEILRSMADFLPAEEFENLREKLLSEFRKSKKNAEKSAKDTEKSISTSSESNEKTSKSLEKATKKFQDETKKLEEELKKPKTIFSRMLDTLKESITGIPDLIKNFKSLFSEGKSVLGEGLMNTFKGLSVGFFEMFKQGDVMAGLGVMEKSVSKTALDFFETGQVKKQNAEDMVSKNVESGKNNVIKSLEQNLGNLNIVSALKKFTGLEGSPSQDVMVNSPTNQSSSKMVVNNYSNPDDSSKNKFPNDYFRSLG